MTISGWANGDSRWIGTENCSFDWRVSQPAPYFRREFEYRKPAQSCIISFSGLGYGELYLNGEKVGTAVLDPVPTHYESRVHWVRHDVTRLLKPGKNVFGVILGSGWYNLRTAEVWHFDKASWVDLPKFIFQLECDGENILASDESWRWTTEGPIVFEQLRNGEFYDARREFPGWCESGFDDSRWKNAKIVPGPGGKLELQTMPPCRVTETLAPVLCRGEARYHRLYDFGRNLAGWARIRVQGESGATVIIRYGELPSGAGPGINNSHLGKCVLAGEFQTDRYTLRGGEPEEWEPRFTYHGFRYVEIEIVGQAKISAIEARRVRTDFNRLGEFSCSEPLLEQLWHCTRNSYESNYVGLPTDCPHREKNGWTGDAALAVQTGLTLADNAEAYRTWLRMLGDVQRTSGQLPGICPSGGWGFNWGGGPAWDAALWEIPWQIFLFTGDDSLLREHYGRLQTHFDYISSLRCDGLVDVGLGDWCPPDWDNMLPCRFSSSCYCCREAQVIGKIAQLHGDREAAGEYQKIANGIAARIHQEFYRGNGIYASGELTAMALALAFDIVPERERENTIQALVTQARAAGHTARFGVIGAKLVPRMLAEHGYIDDAMAFFLQPEEPGWANWMLQGATSLWENWDGSQSQCHIMFGDFAAFVVRYLGGVRFDEEDPGNKRFHIRPLFPEKLCNLSIEYRGIRISWSKHEDSVILKVTLPDAGRGTLFLPDGTTVEIQQEVEWNGFYKKV